MFSWLKDIYNGASGPLSTIEKWIMGALSAVYSFFNGLVSQLWHALITLGSELNALGDELSKAVNGLYHLLQWVIDTGLPQLENWALGELNKLREYSIGVYQWAVSEIHRLGVLVLSELNKLGQWVLRNVWDPLWNAVQGVLHWIEHEGAYVYYLLTHPDKLAAILAEWILSQWMSLGRRFAKPFARWLLHNMILDAPFIGSIIEDIISSLF